MRYLTGVLVSVFLLAPVAVFAQTTNKASLLAALETLLQTLEAEIAQIEAQQQTFGNIPQTTTPSSQTFTTPSGAVIDQSGNVVSTPTPIATVATQNTTSTPAQQPAPYVYVDPLLPQWEGKLSADLSALDPKSCMGVQLAQCQSDAFDAITEVKLAINAGMATSDALSEANTASNLLQSFQLQEESLLTSGGPSGPLDGNNPLISYLQQIVSILTTRQWE